jgi:hypothetical protein
MDKLLHSAKRFQQLLEIEYRVALKIWADCRNYWIVKTLYLFG